MWTGGQGSSVGLGSLLRAHPAQGAWPSLRGPVAGPLEPTLSGDKSPCCLFHCNSAQWIVNSVPLGPWLFRLCYRELSDPSLENLGGLCDVRCGHGQGGPLPGLEPGALLPRRVLSASGPGRSGHLTFSGQAPQGLWMSPVG